ncbi:hypothetical protein J5U22_01904 [Saccharolobus shibatae]|uniref:Penicillin amidase n=2 Tax=Saccharolobus shibatae TaxID=2286 RepID=A0A8F5H093_9CREN|nr:hypothetical protein J5U22_01904 [Saccharolobus shibatae]
MKGYNYVMIGILVTLLVILSIFTTSLSILNPFLGIWYSSGNVNTLNEIISTRGLSGNVNIYIDNNGIAHIYANNLHDLFLAEGYYEASQRLFEIELFGLLAMGNLSSWVGAKALSSDIAMHLIGIPQNAIMSAQYLKHNYPTIYSYLEAFSQGVNDYIDSLNYRDLPLEFKLLNIKPYYWSPEYSLAFGEYMAWSLTSGFNDELESALLYTYFNYTEINEINPYYPHFIDGNLTVIPGDGTVNGYNLTDQGISPQYLWSLNWYQSWATGINKDEFKDLVPLIKYAIQNISDPFISFPKFASNSWVITSDFSTQGPILANDPHLPLFAPSVWIPLQLVAPAFNVTGWSLVGIPGVLIGHTPYTAWGLTTPEGSSSDAYLEIVNGSQYYYNGKWYQMNEYNYTLMGRTYTVYYTNNGPIVARYKNYGISLYWSAWKEPILTVISILLLDNSTSFNDLINAAKYWVIPPQNLAIVSKHHAGIIVAGLYPLINETLPNGKSVLVVGARTPLNGTVTKYEPIGYIPFKYLPQTFDPIRGFAFAPNQPTVWINYPFPFIGGFWSSGGRAEDIYHYLMYQRSVNISDMMKLQSNVTDYWASLLTPLIIKAMVNNVNGSIQGTALNYLRNWNFTFYQNEVAPTIYTYVVAEMVNNSIVKILNNMGLDILNIASIPYIVPDYIYIAQYDPTSIWVNGNFTNLVRQSFVKAISLLEQNLGDNISQWYWGRVHFLEIYNPLGLKALSVGPIQIFGDPHTLAVGSTPYIPTIPLPYVTVGSSLRFIASPYSSQFYGIFPGGPSESLVNAFRENQLPLWLSFKYVSYSGYNYTIIAKITLEA